MALTENIKIDKIEIVGDFKHIQVRERHQILEDGQEISASFNRYVITPDSNIENEPQEIKDLAIILHTREIKDAWIAFKAAQ